MQLTLDQTYDLAQYVLTNNHESQLPPSEEPLPPHDRPQTDNETLPPLSEDEIYNLARYVLTDGREGRLPSCDRVYPGQVDKVMTSHGIDEQDRRLSDDSNITHRWECIPHPPNPTVVIDRPYDSSSKENLPPESPLHSLQIPTVPVLSTAGTAESVLGKRRRNQGPKSAGPSTSSTATQAPIAGTSAGGNAILCSWPGCMESGTTEQIWAHVQSIHGLRGHPRPKDEVTCGWGGCVEEGTSAHVVDHFKSAHNADHDRYRCELSAKVVCEVAGCMGQHGRGRDFKRHAYGYHWHDPQYYYWCETCGQYVRMDQRGGKKDHPGACLRSWMREHCRPGSPVWL